MEESNPLYIKERKKKMLFKKSHKARAKYTDLLNSCLLLRRQLSDVLGEKEAYLYDDPIWINASLLVDEWNKSINEIAKNFPEFEGRIRKLKGYNAIELPIDKKIPFDQIGRKKDGKLYSYVKCERMVTVRQLLENREDAEWKFFSKNYEFWNDWSDWKCNYANQNWPWITYLMAQYLYTIPEMQQKIHTFIRELDEKISKLKKWLIN